MSETAPYGADGPGKTLPRAITSVLVTERRRENLMIADALRLRARNGPAAAFLHHGQAMFRGFLAGAAVIVPAVLWSTGQFMASEDRGPRPTVVRQAGLVAEVGPVLMSAPASVRKLAMLERSEDERRELLDRTIADARDLLLVGRVHDARKVLAEAAVQATPEGAFALAETYDPNVLAANDIRGVNAEVDHARRLYTTALIGGIEGARQRLAALQ